MYIDKLAPIIGEITNYQWYSERETELQRAMELNDSKKTAELLEIMQNKEDEELAEAERRYTESFSDNPNRIFQDFQEVIDRLTQQNFETWFETTKKHFPHFITTSDKWVECCEYIRRLSAVQLRVIEHYGLDLQDAYHTIAVKAAEWYEPPDHEEENRPKIRTGGKKPDTIIFPTDKINSVLYSGLDKGSHPIGVEKSGSKGKITTYLTIDFDALENSTGITFKKLTPFDKRVYIAAGALLQAGNKYFSATQLYRAMGGTGSPAAYQIKNIVDSCRIMMGYRILIDNHQEAADYNYSEFQRELLFMFPVEIRENISINGRTVKICFEFLKDELPLLKFARERKHTETYTLEQWALPFSMTNEHILLDDYFRRNIHRLNGEKGKKETYTGNLTYTTIYKKYGIDVKNRPDTKTRQKISRLSKKGGDIETLLNHYQKTGMIQEYKMHKDGITITV